MRENTKMGRREQVYSWRDARANALS